MLKLDDDYIKYDIRKIELDQVVLVGMQINYYGEIFIN